MACYLTEDRLSAIATLLGNGCSHRRQESFVSSASAVWTSHNNLSNSNVVQYILNPFSKSLPKKQVAQLWQRDRATHAPVQ